MPAPRENHRVQPPPISSTDLDNASESNLLFQDLQNELAVARDALQFEDLLGKMMATFVRITADQIDAEIEHWLKRIGLAIGLDRGTVAEYDARHGIMRTTHCWAREGIRPVPKGIDAGRFLPWLTSKSLTGETVVFSKLHNPSEALTDLQFKFADGVKSNVTIPLKVGGAVIGAVAFGSLRSERNWSPQLIRRLRLVAEVFGSALERRRDIEEIRRLHNELYQVSNTAVMGELTASLAHELNQPLGAILNNAQAASRLLAAEQPDLPEVRAALEDIVRDDGRAADIIRHVRALLRRGDATQSALDPRELLLEVERILKHDAIMKNISFGVEAVRPLPFVLGHKTLLMQALINLILNAFDAVGENGGEPRVVVVTATTRETGQLSIAVRDSGKGIDPEIVPHLFNAFFTTKDKGMGMGLAIVRSVVESHGGQLRVIQNPDRGSTFEFTLPAIPM